MGIVDRRKRQKEEVRAAILSTSWQMVKSEGWQALSIRKIAEAIEYSVPVIYDHFANKEAILFEFAKEGYRLLAAELEVAAAKHPAPEDQIRAMADAYWHFAFRNQEHYQLMFGIGMATCEVEKCMPEKAAFRDKLVAPILTLLENKPAATDSTSVCLKYHTLWSVMHGLVSIKMMGSSDVSDELNKIVLDDAVNGFIRNLKG
ncbi:TetR/AcrR family transcriptional regulator [Flaviaesturariibacter amylovorans]|uniref:TetR/AcrR family transcriptional regulator n=1 Tax=Flaviaesturariibacter amylovorans TaxID=1084520 RepID=A0ABP8HKD7_9BACT